MDRLKSLQILELQEEDPSTDEIKAAYRRLAKKWHPDKNPDPEAKYKFNEIHQAMQALLEEDEEDGYFGHFFDPNEMLYAIIQEYLMRKFYYVQKNSYSSNYNVRSQNYEDDDSDDEYKEFLNLLREKKYTDELNDDSLSEEASYFDSFEDWKEAEKVKRKQRVKEPAPVRPKQLKKKQQEHLDYQRERESAKIREELINKMEQVRLKEERRVQKEEEKRKKMLEETQRNLEETMSREGSYTKNKSVKPPAPVENPPKRKAKKSKKGKRKVTYRFSEDIKESYACSSGDERKTDDDCWDGIDPFLTTLPSCDQLKEVQQRRIEEIMERMRNMQGNGDCYYAREEDAQLKRVSPSFWDSNEDVPVQSHAFQPVDEQNLSFEERARLNRIHKLRELERRRNNQELEEIRAVESYQRRKVAMQKRETEVHSPKPRTHSHSWSTDSTHDKDSSPRGGNSRKSFSWDEEEPSNDRTNNSWDKGRSNYVTAALSSWDEVRSPETETNRWSGGRGEPVGNVWSARIAAQQKVQELVPNTVNDEEAMLQQAINLSKLQYIEDEKARFQFFEEKLQQKCPERSKEHSSTNPSSHDPVLSLHASLLHNEQDASVSSSSAASSSDTSNESPENEDLSSQDGLQASTSNPVMTDKSFEKEPTIEAKVNIQSASSIETDAENIIHPCKLPVVDERLFIMSRTSCHDQELELSPGKDNIEESVLNASTESFKPHTNVSKEEFYVEKQSDLPEATIDVESNSDLESDEEKNDANTVPERVNSRHSPKPSELASNLKRPSSICDVEVNHDSPVDMEELDQAQKVDFSHTREQVVNIPKISLSSDASVIKSRETTQVPNAFEPPLSQTPRKTPLLAKPMKSPPGLSKFPPPSYMPHTTTSMGGGDNHNRIASYEAQAHLLPSQRLPVTEMNLSRQPVFHHADSGCITYECRDPTVSKIPTSNLPFFPSVNGLANFGGRQVPSVTERFYTYQTPASVHYDNCAPEANSSGNPTTAFTSRPELAISDYNRPSVSAFFSMNNVQKVMNQVPSNGLPAQFAKIPASGGVPNNMFPPPFDLPFLGASGFFGYLPPMYPSYESLGGISEWSNSSLPLTYRNLLETPAQNRFCSPQFIPQSSLTRPESDQPKSAERSSEPFPMMQVPFDPNTLQPSLKGCGRGRGFTAKKQEQTTTGANEGKDAQSQNHVLGPPPKDIRLRKRWEKQMQALSTSNN